MRVRGWLGVAAGLAAVVLVAGCGDSGTSGPPATTTPAKAEAFQVGLLVTGSTSDGGWNQLAKEDLEKLAADGTVKAIVLQNVTKDTSADRMRQLSDKGCGLIIAHGYEYLVPAQEVGASGLKAKLAVSGADTNDPNVACLNYDLSGASYELGVIAAKVSKTGKLGFIGGAPFPTVTVMARGFEAGAKSINSADTVAVSYTGWDDPSKAKEQAEAYMAQGIDVIMQNVDAASRGVFEAVKEANAKAPEGPRHAVYTFGANSDQNGNAICGDYTLASAVIRLDEAFARVVKSVQDGSFKGGMIKEDLASGVCTAVINPKLRGSVITPEMEAAVEAARKKLVSGEATIPEEKK